MILFLLQKHLGYSEKLPSPKPGKNGTLFYSLLLMILHQIQLLEIFSDFAGSIFLLI